MVLEEGHPIMNSSMMHQEVNRTDEFSFHKLSYENGGSCIPESGYWDAKAWASFFHKDEKTIKRWVKQYEIPHKCPGDIMLIDRDDFLNHLPSSNGDDNGKKKKTR